MCEIIRSFNIKPGTEIGNYKILRSLGRGYEGQVFAVAELRTGIKRALKIFPNGDSESAKKIAHTAKFFERLAPTGVVVRYHYRGQSHLAGKRKPIAYLVFDLVEGLTLKEHVRCLHGRRAYREREILKLLVAIVEKIARVHRLGFGVVDFDHGGNVIVLPKTHEPVFVDLESGEPGDPNRDLENDLYELLELVDLIFPSALRRDLYKSIRTLIEDSLVGNVRRDTFRRLGKSLSNLLHETATP